MQWNDFNKFPWSIPLGSVLRIPIRLHVTFFILWIAQTLGSIYYGTWYVILSLIVMGPLLLLTIVVHELGHCLAARSIGGTAESILLWPLGGLAYIGYNTTYSKAIWVAAAGPLTHIPMVAIWVALLFPAYHASTGSWHITLHQPPVDQSHFGHALIVVAILLNITLFAFNILVPAYPLDGGRILANTLMAMGASMRMTAIATVAIATPVAVGLFVFGIVVFQMVTILVAVFILYSTFQLFMAIRHDKLSEHPLFASVSAGGAGSAAGVDGGSPANATRAATTDWSSPGSQASKSGTAAGFGTPGYPGPSSGMVTGRQPGSAYYVGNAV
ncbi:hypothetical protein Vafri_21409 [Volvox africanus]|uniref:Peptidase M50 domain-containing protein n=1 Tax=Volvox africanus TaxID=51714 RepID=A0A8J4FEW4_9CHLO|nr:hypothetical protein Vafri_21409 [Volvox africanus]